MKAKVYATDLANKLAPRLPMYNNEWRISETSVVPTTSTIWGENQTLTTEACEESPYQPLRVGNLIAEMGEPDFRDFQTRLSYRIG
jgi:hypothetical protein